VREAAQIQYHSLVMVLGGEEFDAWRSTSLRIARVGMLLFVLVFGATYTANLAAFFTRPNFELIGPKSKDALADAKVCVQQAVILPVVQQSIGSHIMPPPNVQMSGLMAQQEWCSQAVLDERASAMVSLVVNLKEFLDSGGCSDISHVSTLDFAPVPFQLGFVPGRGSLPSTFGEELDAAIVRYMRSPAYTNLRIKWLFDGFFCPGEGPGEASAGAAAVSFKQMRGLFLVCGVIAAVALLIAAAELAWHARTAGRIAAADDDSPEGLTEVQMLTSLLHKVDDLAVASRIASSTDKIADAYRIIDKDGSGQLTHDELLRGLRRHKDLRALVGLQDTASMADFEALYKSSDGDGDKQISLDEFINLCSKWAERVGKRASGRDMGVPPIPTLKVDGAAQAPAAQAPADGVHMMTVSPG